MISLLENDCGENLPLLRETDKYGLERYRYAALKLSQGNIDKLREAIAVAKIDWRDLLVAAGFGHDVSAHKRWEIE